MKGLRGKIGDLVFREMPDGSIVVSQAPTRKKKKGTPAQKEYHNGTFKNRTQWAQHVYPIYAQLAAERSMITAYSMAISDAAHPPIIHQVLRKDACILVDAWDEIMVAGVKVTVRDAQGKLLEVEDTRQVEKDLWEYTPRH